MAAVTVQPATHPRPAARRRLALALALALLASCLGAGTAAGRGAKDLFFAAEACQRGLAGDRARQKYRHNWLRCIDKYREVYREDPDGAWAAAGLYRAAEMYFQLARRSGLAGDRREGLDLLARIVRRFPDSAYRARAEKRLGGSDAPARPAPAPAPAEASDTAAEALFDEAERCAAHLARNPRRTKHRDVWLRCIERYQDVYRHNPTGPWAAAGLYKTATLYRELHRYSYLDADRDEAVELLRHIAARFPGSRYAPRAEADLGAMGEVVSPAAPAPAAPGTGDIGRIIAEARGEAQAQDSAQEAPRGGPVTVSGLRYWSNPSYTRVVVDVEGATEYTHRLLKKDPEIDKPQRLFVDLADSRLGEDLQRQVPINDDLLLDARAGQFDPRTVRVVVDIKSFKTYKIFSLRNPFRIVIDVWGESARAAADAPAPAPAETPVPDAGELPPGALARQLALGVRRIVIDPGHGGRDYGAPGYLKGVHEKYIVLEIAKRLAPLIEARLGCEVVLTRDSDRFLTLEERTAIANTRNADLFVSIHTNAARDRRAYGIETFFLNLATDNDAILVAARENATSEKNISDLQAILLDLMQNAKINESSRLASHVQSSIYGHLRGRYSQVRNKGVKQAPFYVLLGAQMPAILVETSFISNARECKRLTDPGYQKDLCEGIVRGIETYIRETNPTALLERQRGGEG